MTILVKLILDLMIIISMYNKINMYININIFLAIIAYTFYVLNVNFCIPTYTIFITFLHKILDEEGTNLIFFSF
jgi:hypothetical protein